MKYRQTGKRDRFENERIPMAFFLLLFAHRFRRASARRQLFSESPLKRSVCLFSVRRHKIRYREGKERSDATRSTDREAKDPGHKGQTAKEIASHAKSRASMQPPNQSSIDTIDSLPFFPNDYLISTLLSSNAFTNFAFHGNRILVAFVASRAIYFSKIFKKSSINPFIGVSK